MIRYSDYPDEQAWFEEMAQEYFDTFGIRDDSECANMSFSELVDSYYDDIVEWIEENQEESESYVDELLEEDPDWYEHW